MKDYRLNEIQRLLSAHLAPARGMKAKNL